MGFKITMPETKKKNFRPSLSGKTSFLLKDINFSAMSEINEDEYSSNVFNKSDRTTTALEVYEFQPDYQSNLLESISDIVKTGVNMVTGLFNTSETEESKYSSSGESASIVNLYDNLNTFMYDIASAKDNKQDTALIDIPVNDIFKKLFRGIYTNYFEIPYFGEYYLHADGNAGWSTEGLEKRIGETLSNVVQKYLPVDLPAIPEWTGSSDMKHDPLQVKFTLYNNTMTNLIKNFNYVNALCSGAYWSYITILLKSPNIYHVHCPGRFEYFFCTADIKVEHLGKKRKLSNPNKFIDGTNASSDIARGFFPDGYTVDITFNSLLPNCYNIYLSYLKGGGSSKPAVGDTIEESSSITEVFAKTIKLTRSTFSRK